MVRPREVGTKCAKCGVSAKEDPTISLHRFPYPSKTRALRTEIWAMFCYPDEEWTFNKLEELYGQHKMICSRHFDDTAYTNIKRERLNKFAVPIGARHMFEALREKRNKDKLVEQTTIHDESTSNYVDINHIGSEIEVPEKKIKHSKPSEQKHQQDFIRLKKLIDPTMIDDDVEIILVVTEEESVEEKSIACSGPQQSIENIDWSKKSSAKYIFKDFPMPKNIELPPRELKLFMKCRKYLLEIIKVRKRLKMVTKQERTVISTLITNEYVKKLIRRRPDSSICLLLQSHLINVPRKLAGPKMTLEDNLLALSLYKKSSLIYKLLCRIFKLPSVQYLNSLLHRIPIVSGVNQQVIKNIKEMTALREIKDNVCVLAFGEMPIRKSADNIDQNEGQEHGSSELSSVSHLQMFMAIGVEKPWIQPIAVDFSSGSATVDKLTLLIQEGLHACISCGFHIVGTMCDTGSTNIDALDALGSTTDHPYFTFDKHEIVTILDPSDLLTCFRNDFMKHKIQFPHEKDGKRMKAVARWQDIIDFFVKDIENSNFTFAPILTLEHLQPSNKQKTKANLAAQVMSHEVAAGIFAKVAQNELPQNASATATIISRVNKLYDFMNGKPTNLQRDKLYHTHQPHLFVKHMRKSFKLMKFLGATESKSQEGWIRTLRATERLYNNVKKYNIKRLQVKRLSKRLLEYFFRHIKRNCGQNKSPTSRQFVSALKASMVTFNNDKKLEERFLYDMNNFLERPCE